MPVFAPSSRIRIVRPLLLVGLARASIVAPPLWADVPLRVVPVPRRVERGAGDFSLRGTVSIAVTSDDTEDRFAAELLRDEIVASGGKAEILAGARGDIVLTRAGAPAEVGDEGYRIEVRKDGVKIAANRAAGVFYGVQTLRQMIGPDGIPVSVVVDWPALRWRGLQDDISRGPMPTLESLERRIRTAAEFKINLYGLYMENAYAFKDHPLIGPPERAIGEEDLRELVAFARRHHVEILPEQQSFAHLGGILKLDRYAPMAEAPGSATLSPANPQTLRFLQSLYDDLVPNFPGPFFHVGGDEVPDLGRGQSKKLVEEKGEGGVYIGHLRKLGELLGRHGKRMMFWGDVALKHPELLKELPSNAVVATWDYLPKPTYQPLIKPFRQAGLDVFVCPGVGNWNSVFPNLSATFANIRTFTREGQELGAAGQLMCTWDDGGDSLFGMLWCPILYGAAAAWQAGDSDPKALLESFDWALLRSPGDEAARAIDLMGRAGKALTDAGGPYGDLQLMWLNPFQNVDRRLLTRIEAAGPEVGRLAEQAVEQLEFARRRARRNADLLDYHLLAAHRLQFIGLRLTLCREIRERYVKARRELELGHRAEVRQLLIGIYDRLGDGRNLSLQLRDEYQRLWLGENRPYGLGNILALHDHDAAAWLDEILVFRRLEVSVAFGEPLPMPEDVGLAVAQP